LLGVRTGGGGGGGGDGGGCDGGGGGGKGEAIVVEGDPPPPPPPQAVRTTEIQTRPKARAVNSRVRTVAMFAIAPLAWLRPKRTSGSFEASILQEKLKML
jgi:hypothetical protein